MSTASAGPVSDGSAKSDGPAYTSVGPAHTSVGPAYTSVGPAHTSVGPAYTSVGPAHTSVGPALTRPSPLATVPRPMDAPTTELPSPAEGPTDVELVKRAQGGDGDAFATLVERHQRQIYRLALRMTGSDADAQEVLQEAFLNAYEKLDKFRGDSQFSSWLYRIAANSALMRLRRKRRAPDNVTAGESAPELLAPKFTDDGHQSEPPRSDWSTRADDALASRELGAAIDHAVKELPEDYRVVFLLKDVEELSNEDIAKALDLSVPAVKSRLHRARLALREQLGEFFGERDF